MKFDVDGAEPRYEILGICFVLLIVSLVVWVGVA